MCVCVCVSVLGECVLSVCVCVCAVLCVNMCVVCVNVCVCGKGEEGCGLHPGYGCGGALLNECIILSTIILATNVNERLRCCCPPGGGAWRGWGRMTYNLYLVDSTETHIELCIT